jgi:hypothetical protein
MGGDAETTALIQANNLRTDALDVNRSGLLAPEQARWLRESRFTWRMLLLAIGVGCAALGAWGLLHQESWPGGRFGAFTLLIAGGAFLLLRFSDSGRSYAAEIASGRVSSVDGFIRIRHSSSSNNQGGTYHSYYYKIDGREFGTTEEGAKLINAQRRYRIYYLPNSDIMLNIEALGTPFASSTEGGVQLDADDIAVIVGESVRQGFEKTGGGAVGFPGMVIRMFEGMTSKLRVIVGFFLGGQDSTILNFYRRMLASGPGSLAVSGIGDEATFSHGQLLVRRGDIFIMIMVVSVEAARDSEHLLNIEKRLAILALRSLR